MTMMTHDPIHLVEDGLCDPAWNMAVDDALLDLRQSGALSGTWMRLFGWSPPAISIGRLQSAAAELDLPELARAGIAVVRRSTGGKAVYHAHELTYSLVGGIPDPIWGSTLHDTYRRVTAVLAAALAQLGVETNLAPGRTARHLERASKSGAIAAAASDANAASGSNAANVVVNDAMSGVNSDANPLIAACFAVAYGHELVHAGRKICGSAQRRLTHAFLQHGSLLLGPEQARLAQFLPSAGADRSALAARLEAETVDVSSALGRRVESAELIDAVRTELASRFGSLVQAGELPEMVRREAERRLESVRVTGLETAGPGHNKEIVTSPMEREDATRAAVDSRRASG